MKFPGEVMKLSYDVMASHIDIKEDQRKKGQSPKLQNTWKFRFAVVERLSNASYRISGGRRTKPKIVRINQLWRYHGLGNYTWDNHGGPKLTDDQVLDGANEGGDHNGGDLDFLAESADGVDLLVSANIPGTLEADNVKLQHEADALRPEDQDDLQQAR